MKEIATLQAKNQLSALLDLVAQGEEFLITRHGKPIARLLPPEGAHRKTLAQEAVEQIHALAREANLGSFDWEEWKTFRDEGRR
jgi:prevent-host-death family protein